MTYLDFEKEIEELDKNLDTLKNPYQNEGISSINKDKIDSLQSEIDKKIENLYSNLNSWQKTKVARHENRPRSNYYIEKIFTEFEMISGDRSFAEDEAVLTGFAKLDGKSVLVIGQEKGFDTSSRIKRNFGMMRPEGYRKCIRLMKIANNFKIPIVVFIDTPGAFPGKGAEERGQAEAIASSISCCMSLDVPTISVVIGEGGSGGAIALASSNKVFMLEHSIYSVISPEGCASILWKDVTKSNEAAEAMKITAQDLYKFNIIDGVIKEPKGGAHRDPQECANSIKECLNKQLEIYSNNKVLDIKEERKNKFMKIGKDLPSEINFSNFNTEKIKTITRSKKIKISFFILLILLIVIYFSLS